ncbi:MAG: alkaline phosphatase [Ruminococcaceae bacterium]|nr:alkaline phosphatase [Oscillospiraceae bacterium]
MFAFFASFWGKVTASLMSAFISFGVSLGAYIPATTENAENYYDSNIKNVIFLIGDGMGYNHLEKTKLERNVTLTMDTFTIQGSSRTRSLTNDVTDSAAGGTALSCGVRTYNSGVGVYLLDPLDVFIHPINITELCRDNKMLTGVITTDETSGATPASFSAHTTERYKSEDITDDQFRSDINLIWGTENGVATKEMADEYGYEYVTTYNEMMALEEGSKSFAQFTNDLWTLKQSDENNPTLSQMTEKAIDLLDDGENGFFLMVEGAHIDKHSHNNESENMTEATEEFDRAIKIALDYAKEDGNTLVIVTADHETGAITLNDKGEYEFTSDDHSALDVPLRVYGSEKLIKNNETVNNYEIPIRIAYVLGFTEEDFPISEIAA